MDIEPTHFAKRPHIPFYRTRLARNNAFFVKRNSDYYYFEIAWHECLSLEISVIHLKIKRARPFSPCFTLHFDCNKKQVEI